MAEHSFNRVAIEQIGVEFEAAANSIRSFQQKGRYIELGSGFAQIHQAQAEARKAKGHSRCFLKREHHLEQRVLAQISVRPQFFNQLIGVVSTILLAAAGTFVLVKVVDAVVGLRVDQEDESLGLDLSQHGERAYNE